MAHDASTLLRFDKVLEKIRSGCPAVTSYRSLKFADTRFYAILKDKELKKRYDEAKADACNLLADSFMQDKNLAGRIFLAGRVHPKIFGKKREEEEADFTPEFQEEFNSIDIHDLKARQACITKNYVNGIISEKQFTKLNESLKLLIDTVVVKDFETEVETLKKQHDITKV